MDSLPSLCKDIFPDSKICKEIKMKRNKTTNIVVNTIAPFFKNEIISDVKTNNFTLIIDEITDVSIKKSLIVLVRYFKDGRVVDRILAVIKVEDASAEALFVSIKHILDTQSVPYKNLIALAADNASTMMRRKNGVQAKLRELVPNLYVQGCLCHSLHLCSSAATKELPSVVEQFVRNIYAYFAHSTKRILELGECQVFVNEKPHKMLYPSQTRWLSLKWSRIPSSTYASELVLSYLKGWQQDLYEEMFNKLRPNIMIYGRS
ncbi:Zinc finger protein 862-like Protein [Tribolium castaneum]|uniref:Zinc finger protein 862-like Protein n=1 Tax=Tribolium castaneum TaxID=7070 RepID=D7EKH4_TRICA|nr:Zinc finger protein 862-like Protein [Tribolium castaneum]